jgi:hypothetical protein
MLFPSLEIARGTKASGPAWRVIGVTNDILPGAGERKDSGSRDAGVRSERGVRLCACVVGGRRYGVAIWCRYQSV